MAEDMTQEPTSESVPVAQEPSDAVVGEPQQVQADQSTAPVSGEQQETANQTEPEIEDWNGNDVEKLPKPLQARARGMLRYLHEKSQEAAQVKHLAQAHQELMNHPEFKEFIEWKEAKLNAPQQPAMEVEPITDDDFLAAQTDPNKFMEVQKRIMMQEAAPLLNELKELREYVETDRREKAETKASQQLDAFASQHPDFWKKDPVLMKAALTEIVGKRKGTVEDAYNYVLNVEKQLQERAKADIKKQVDEKKKAVTAAPSKSMDPEIIYVKDSREATRVAFENAKLGKRVDVRVKR